MRILLAFLLAFNGYLPAFSQTSGGVISASNIEGLDVEKNYILNGGGEKNTKGWSEFDDGPVARPVDGTGSTAANLTFAVTTINPLEDRGSFLLTKSAADAQGEGVSYDFKVPRAKRGERQCIFFDYEINSGTFTAGTDTTDSDLIAYIYDKDAGQLIEPANFKLFRNTQDKFGGCFSPFNVASDDYRLILHVANTNANAWTMKIDNVKVGVRNTPRGPPDTDWQSYTSTISNAGSGVFSQSFRYRRDGPNLVVQGILTTTTPGTGSNVVTASLPAGLTVDTSVISVFNESRTFGSGNFLSSSNRYPAVVVGGNSYTPGNNTVAFVNSLTNTVLIGSNFAASTQIGFEFTVPIQGWSSNTQMSSDIVWTDDVGSVHAFAVPDTVVPDGYLLCNGQAVSRATYHELFKKIGTTHGSGDGSTTFNLPDYRGRFLRGVSGGTGRDPDAASRTAMASGGNTGNNVGSVQGDQFRSHKHDLFYGISGSFEPVPTINGNANDNSGVSIMNTASIGNAGGNETRPLNAYVNYYIKWTRTAAPTIASSPVVALHASGTAGDSIGTGNSLIKFTTVETNTHGTAAYSSSTGLFTAPESGYYRASWLITSAAVTLSTSQRLISFIALDGTQYRNGGRAVGNGVSNPYNSGGSIDSIYLRAGQTLSIYATSNVATTAAAGTADCFFTVTKVGP